MKSDKFVLVLVASLALLLAGCGGGSSSNTPDDSDTMPDPAIGQRANIESAIMAAETAVAEVDDDSTDAVVSAADSAIAAARAAIAAATAVPQHERNANTGTVDAIASRLTAAKESRTMAMDAARSAADMAMAATAAKLHAGIYAPAADATGTVVGAVHAAYNDADTPTSGTAADTHIMVSRGTGGDSPTTVTQALSEDGDATVAALHGWTGKKYTASGDNVAGTYEAYVYSHIEATMGRKFGSAAAVTTEGEFEYQLAEGVFTVPDSTTDTAIQTRIGLTGVTRTAGTETFNLPSPNPTGVSNILVPGSYHGVSGTYTCVPTTPADGCSAAVAASGFTLAGGTWTFRPSNANARVTDAGDQSYASFGWWLHTDADGDLTASAFVDRKGATDAASGIDNLNGTATYRGGAAGKYALSSTTGGTNDAGHFTARATLNANFTNNTAATAITGTIDQFVGADGMSRDWSVKLNGSAISDAGVIGTATDGTEWTISETAADDSGSWTGSLQENGDDGVPEIATGTFYTEYGTAGKMVGAFGANEE